MRDNRREGKTMEEYRREIVKMVEKIEDPNFLRKIYTIIIRHIKRVDM